MAHQLKGPDASILATAEQWSCTQVYTRDTGLLKCDGQLGFKITVPDDPPPPKEPDPDLFSITEGWALITVAGRHLHSVGP